ncbi:hypothetical protein GGI04_001580 [Coemansia thaxteri]|nr:hypothetical protein GGI04_001580 [Coemansia thaxteri]KAJ2472842.1 hypothetical protein GGI02_001294 [Coemansia sp. RSA 2322]
MAGDGNCLFRALADQVDGTPDTHSRHRDAVCVYMQRHPDEFAPFMDESSPFDRYVDNMRRNGVYGGNLELVAFARNYRVDIKVYQMGGTVFVISGAPADDPTSAARSMPTVHIAYHSYEHYSSVRNCGGPHTGLPDLAIVKSPDPQTTSAPDDDAPPTDTEKMIMSSTAVENHSLVRRLLRCHDHHTDRVIELLIEWMARDDDPLDNNPWWAKDGPVNYDGPSSTDPPHPQACEETPPTPTVSPLIVGLDTAVADGDMDVPDKTAESLETTTPVPKPSSRAAQHYKGAARHKKTESKKRQKEMAKIKKRKAAREALAATTEPSPAATQGDAADLAGHLAHIYI